MSGAVPDPTTRRVIVLAGAHKTASSHMQQSLLDASVPLLAEGVAAIAPSVMRQDLTPVAQLLRDGVSPQVAEAAARGFLDLHAGKARCAVLMDENILGGTDRKMLLRRRRLYPWAPNRVARVLTLFRGERVELALAVRSLATFLPSCWSESLHHGRYSGFREFIHGVEIAALGWDGLAERLQAAVPGLRLTVWRYEDYAAFGAGLYERILGKSAGAAVAPAERIMRPGISAEAVQWLARQPNPDKAMVQEARRRFPKAAGAPGYDPWTAAERREIEAAYAADIAALAARPGVTVLRP